MGSEPSLQGTGDRGIDYGMNAYEGCERCGHCCQLTIICVSPEEAQAMDRYIKENGIVPVDRGPHRCPLQSEEGTCMVYPVRSQTCRLYNCHVPRRDLLAAHPEIVIDDDKPLLDMRRAFLHGDFRDPRYL